MKFQSHVPNYVDSPPAIPLQEFDSLIDILSDPWIKKWSEGKWFFRYCWSPNEGKWSKALLMCEWREGWFLRRTWWVLGYLDEIPNLPKWKER
jgi:hypothetical protein